MARRRELGSALIIALVVVIIAVGIGGAFLADTVFRTKAQNMAVESDVAQMIVDAAIEKARRALWVYKTNNTYPWDDVLAAHSTISIDSKDHLDNYRLRKDDSDFQAYRTQYYQAGVNTAYDAPMPTDPNHFFGNSMPFGEGAFFAVVRDNDDADGNLLHDSDNKLLVYVTATLPDETQRQVEVMVEYLDPTYTPDDAIIVDGSILFNGTPGILGIKGSAHANGDIEIKGTPTFTVSANATGTVDPGSSSPPPGGYNSGVPNVDIPAVNPQSYKSLADYILTGTGTILVVSTNQTIVPGNQGWSGWTFKNGTWTLSGGDIPPIGTYYAEASNVKMTGAGNTPMRTMSVICEQSIETTGNIQLQPVLTGTLLVAGGDVKLGGTAGASYTGLVAANEQIQTLGNFSHQGVLLAKNSGDTFNTVTAGSSVEPDSQFGGSMMVTYNGGLQTILTNPNNSVVVRNARRIK